MDKRLASFKNSLKEKGVDGFIVTNHFNIFYLTGFKGVSQAEREAILTVTQKNATLITARLYQTEARLAQSRLAKKLKSGDLNVKIVNERNEILESIKESLAKCRSVGFEGHNLTHIEFKRFKKALKGSKLTPSEGLVEELRVIKDQAEIANIKKAQIISQKAFKLTLKTIKVGQTEEEIADRLERIIKDLGGQDLAFDTIVASGPNSALPHYVTGKRKIKSGDILLCDFGAKVQNYCADLTRTVFMGRASDRQRNVYTHVQVAQKAAIAKIATKTPAKKAFASAFDVFKEQELEENFLHSLGHGIGLEVHEKPSLSQKSRDKLVEGMVFSVEPGLYFPSWGGVRIEDLVTVRNGKAEILGNFAQFIQV